jgi:hypothetical protein
MNQEEQAKKIQKVIAKAWLDDEYKRKLISNPMETLNEEGLEAPRGVEIRVVESTEKVVYLVLPPRPSDDEAKLEEVVKRNAAYSVCSLCSMSLSLG